MHRKKERTCYHVAKQSEVFIKPPTDTVSTPFPLHPPTPASCHTKVVVNLILYLSHDTSECLLSSMIEGRTMQECFMTHILGNKEQ